MCGIPTINLMGGKHDIATYPHNKTSIQNSVRGVPEGTSRDLRLFHRSLALPWRAELLNLRGDQWHDCGGGAAFELFGGAAVSGDIYGISMRFCAISMGYEISMGFSWGFDGISQILLSSGEWREQWKERSGYPYSMYVVPIQWGAVGAS